MMTGAEWYRSIDDAIKLNKERNRDVDNVFLYLSELFGVDRLKVFLDLQNITSIHDYVADTFNISREELTDILSYQDIYEELKSVSLDKSKHNYDIYFANQALVGNTIYYDNDIATQLNRLYYYFYQEYDVIWEYLDRYFSCIMSCGDYLESFICEAMMG